MLNSCPAYKSCGARYPIWTKDAMPTEVGVKTVIYAQEVHPYECEHNSIKMHVMRCSWNTSHDFIYKYIPNDYYEYSCDRAFCGMYA